MLIIIMMMTDYEGDHIMVMVRAMVLVKEHASN